MRVARWSVPVLVLAAVVTAAFSADSPRPSLQTTELGVGGASFVLVHSIGGSRTDWLPTVKRLKDRYKVVMVELPGHGTSPLPDPFALETAADMLDSVIALQKPESTIVVGQGVGGVLAVQALARHPGRARGLVLIDAALKSPMQIDDQQVGMIVRFMDENYETFKTMAFAKMGRDSAESAILFAKMAAVQPATVKAYMRNLLRVDANRDLKSLGMPVPLVVSGRTWKGEALWGPTSKSMGYDDSTMVTPHRIVSAGTLVMKDQPDSLAAILTGYATERFAAKK